MCIEASMKNIERQQKLVWTLYEYGATAASIKGLQHEIQWIQSERKTKKRMDRRSERNPSKEQLDEPEGNTLDPSPTVAPPLDTSRYKRTKNVKVK